MPKSKSARSTTSASTARTVDDVMSEVDSALDRGASMRETKQYITTNYSHDSKLVTESIDEIENIETVLFYVSNDPRSLMNLMLRCGVVLGGIQATSFLYPKCEVEDAPWDFFCRQDSGNDFVDGFKHVSNAEPVEDMSTGDNKRVVCLRRHVDGVPKPINIRIYISLAHPYDSVLSLKNSYEHTILSPVGVFCLWPKLLSQNRYRAFGQNEGTERYPMGKAKYHVKINKMALVVPKGSTPEPRVHIGITDKVEVVMLKNNGCDKKLFERCANEMRNIVYAVSPQCVRYLGTTAHM